MAKANEQLQLAKNKSSLSGERVEQSRGKEGKKIANAVKLHDSQSGGEGGARTLCLSLSYKGAATFQLSIFNFNLIANLLE